MQQIENYLSNIYDINSILLIAATEEFQQLILYFIQEKKIKKIYYCAIGKAELKGDIEIKQNDLVEKYTIEEIQCNGIQVDAVLFDKYCRQVVDEMKLAIPRYLIGRLGREEEYFDLWERYRLKSDFIYLERERQVLSEKNGNNANHCEVLEWKRHREEVELSVIIPVYNVAPYLPECIDSLIKWKADYVEFLFINDGSTDCSEDIIRKYMKKDHRIRMISKENGGCASARNRGIAEAKGRYLGFVDSDDFIDEGMFYKLFRRIVLGNFDFAYCGYNEFYENSGKSANVLNDCLKEPYLNGTYRQDKVQMLAVNTRVAIWRGIYRKDVLDNCQIRFHEDLKRFDDLPFRVEYLFAAKSAVCVPEYLYYYRLGREGQDIACTDECFLVHFDIFRHLDQYVDRMNDRRAKDLLQVVKIQTHGFAATRIKGKLRKEYLHRAKLQLDRNMGFLRTVLLMMMYTGKTNIGWYTRAKLCFGFLEARGLEDMVDEIF